MLCDGSEVGFVVAIGPEAGAEEGVEDGAEEGVEDGTVEGVEEGAEEGVDEGEVLGMPEVGVWLDAGSEVEGVSGGTGSLTLMPPTIPVSNGQ